MCSCTQYWNLTLYAIGHLCKCVRVISVTLVTWVKTDHNWELLVYRNEVPVVEYRVETEDRFFVEHNFAVVGV